MSKTILYITNGISGSGGLERVVSLKASYFADRYNYNVHIITLNENNVQYFYHLSKRIKTHNINAPRNIISFYINYYNGIKLVIKNISPDIIFVADDGLKGVLFPIIFRPKCKIIYERHTTKSIHNNGVKKKFINTLMNLGARKFDKFVVLTNHNKKEWTNSNNLVVIPNPLPFNIEKRDFNINLNKIISVGAISHIKGHDILVKAWHKIYTQFPKYTLHIYGKQKDNYDLINQYIEHNDLNEIIFLHPPTSEIKQKYLESAICILPSRVEGFGMVLIEAMACSVPCIATNCEGPRDIITHEKNGYLVNIEDVDDIANKLIELLSNQDKLKQMSYEAYNSAKEYDINIIMKKWNDIIN